MFLEPSKKCSKKGCGFGIIFSKSFTEEKHVSKALYGTSLMAQWVRTRLPMQEVQETR